MGFRVYDASPRYIYQTSFGYCFRFVFPADLRTLIAKNEIRFSLKTRDQSKAKALSRRLAGFIQDLCCNLRDLATDNGNSHHPALDQKQLNELIRTYFRSVIDGDFKSSITAEILATRIFNEDLPGEFAHYKSYPQVPQIEQPSCGIIRTINTDKGLGTDELPRASMRLSKLISLYIEEQIRGGNWTTKTHQEYEAACNLIHDVIGDIPVSDIGHQEMQTYKQTLLKLPSHMKTSPKYKGKTIKLHPLLPSKGQENDTRAFCGRYYLFLDYAASGHNRQSESDDKRRCDGTPGCCKHGSLAV